MVRIVICSHHDAVDFSCFFHQGSSFPILPHKLIVISAIEIVFAIDIEVQIAGSISFYFYVIYGFLVELGFVFR